MKKSLALSIVILFTVTPARAEDAAPAHDTRAASAGTSTRQAMKSNIREVKHGIKTTARQIKYGIKNGVKNGTREVKQGVKDAFR